jgi:hypothetical protein
MIYQDLKIVEVPLTVIAPWARKDFFDIGMTALLLRHFEVELAGIESGYDDDRTGSVVADGSQKRRSRSAKGETEKWLSRRWRRGAERSSK